MKGKGTTRHPPEYYIPALRKLPIITTAALREETELKAGAGVLIHKLVGEGVLERTGEWIDRSPVYKFTGSGNGTSDSVSRSNQSKSLSNKLNKDARIAKAADILFDLKKMSVLDLIHWIELTKEMM